MGWSEVAARNHARRLQREGWLERCPMIRGNGSLFLATRKGLLVLGSSSPAQRRRRRGGRHSGCAWTAAWLTVRGRTFLGAREVLTDPEWSGQLNWLDRHSFKRSGHRPDLVGMMGKSRVPIEVELQPKSKARLDAILKLHVAWIGAHKSHGIILHLR